MLDLNKTITELEIRFEKHLGEEDTKLRFTREELGGMTEDFFEGLVLCVCFRAHNTVMFAYHPPPPA